MPIPDFAIALTSQNNISHPFSTTSIIFFPPGTSGFLRACHSPIFYPLGFILRILDIGRVSSLVCILRSVTQDSRERMSLDFVFKDELEPLNGRSLGGIPHPQQSHH